MRITDIPPHNFGLIFWLAAGPEGFYGIHQRFVLEAYKVGLLTPPITDLPEMVRNKIILMGDSPFLKAVASTKGEKDRLCQVQGYIIVSKNYVPVSNVTMV